MGHGANRTIWRAIIPCEPERILTRLEPPYGCTYVEVYGSATNGWATIYTVASGKAFYLTDWAAMLGCVANSNGIVQIRTAAHATKLEISVLYALANTSANMVSNQSIAIQMDAGDYIRAYSNNVNGTMYFWLNGYTRDI